MDRSEKRHEDATRTRVHSLPRCERPPQNSIDDREKGFEREAGLVA
jgi:hypothetical protein